MLTIYLFVPRSCKRKAKLHNRNAATTTTLYYTFSLSLRRIFPHYLSELTALKKTRRSPIRQLRSITCILERSLNFRQSIWPTNCPPCPSNFAPLPKNVNKIWRRRAQKERGKSAHTPFYTVVRFHADDRFWSGRYWR